MKKATQIVFRRLTQADFYNINKPKHSEPRGGGQTYIDFPTSAVHPGDWMRFFDGHKTRTSKSGPYWRFEVNSIGVGKSQVVELGQRRHQSFNIRMQTLGRRHSNRVYAWDPQYSGFPQPKDPAKRVGVPNLVIYLIRTWDGELWAGWFQAAKPDASWDVDPRLMPMFTKRHGNVYLDPGIDFDPAHGNWPFRTAATAASGVVGAPPPAEQPLQPTTAPAIAVKAPEKKPSPRYKQKTEDHLLQELFAEDESMETGAEKKQVVVNIKKRNSKIVAALKALYGGECQLTGRKFVFKKTDGELYCEVHHLIALGEGGGDSPYNLIMVSPLIHRMLHYANVSGFDLNRIVDNKLDIEINGEPFTITWHPKHAERVYGPARRPEGLS